MKKKILVIMGQPNRESFCGAIAETYANAASDNHEVKKLFLSDLKFDPILRAGFKSGQELEPDLAEAQKLILWAEHLVFVTPVWWGSVPALLKGFIDRIFLPGFAFKYHSNDPWWDKLLSGRTARIIYTADSPKFWLWFSHRDAAIRTLKNATLEFCGVKPVKTLCFPMIRKSTPEQREKWLKQTASIGKMGD